VSMFNATKTIGTVWECGANCVPQKFNLIFY
jgi:hypothetical protein